MNPKALNMHTQNFTQRLAEFSRKPSFLFFVFYLCFAFWFNDLLKPYYPHKNETNFVWDGAGYYSYLPATFYYGNFEFDGIYRYFLPVNDAGERYPKYTYGVALLEAPMYGAGYLYALATGQSLNGFSTAFADCTRWGIVLYGFIGLWFLRKFLLHFFSELITAITLFACFFCSMYYMYIYVQGEIAHGYLTVLFSLFLYCTLRWHQNPSRFYSVCLGVILAVVTIIRVTEIYIVFFFIFWNVKTSADIKAKALLLLANVKHLIWIPLLGFVFWVPQLLFWKRYLGAYITNPYINEPFFWSDPQILNILFSYRKGLITYTPLYLLAFAGVFFIPKRFPLSKYLFVAVLVLTTYVFSCWWDWCYGGGFGSRPFCQQIAFLSIALASVLDFVFLRVPFLRLKNWLSAATLVFLFSCCFFNFSLAYQYQELRRLHPYNTSKINYWGVFRRFHYDAHFEDYFWYNLSGRDEDAWRRGEKRNDVINGKVYEWGQ